MRELGKRILRQSVPVALVLALLGYIFAEVVVIVAQMNGAAPDDPSIRTMRWQAPLRMAVLGVVLLGILHLIVYAVRRKKKPEKDPATITIPPVAPAANNPLPPEAPKS